MTASRRVRFVHAQVGWMLVSLLLLAVLGSLSLEVYFALSLIGLLVVIELTAPFNVTPRWRARLKWPILLGLAGFGYVVARRVQEFLPGVF